MCIKIVKDDFFLPLREFRYNVLYGDVVDVESMGTVGVGRVATQPTISATEA